MYAGQLLVMACHLLHIHEGLAYQWLAASGAVVTLMGLQACSWASVVV